MRVRLRHKIAFFVIRILAAPVFFFLYGYRCKKYKLKKKQPYLIVSNHIAQLDPFFVSLAIKTHIYFIATDMIFNNSIFSKIMVALLNPIPITKGTSDLQTLRDARDLVEQGGSVGVFPAGNTSYSGKEPYIAPTIAKLAKFLKVPVLCFAIEGMYGVAPRWSGSRRRGKSFGHVVREISAKELEELSSEQIHRIIVGSISLKPHQFALGQYKSKKSAEYLERALCVCPKCHAMGHLYSHGQEFGCKKCGLIAKYNQDLQFEYAQEQNDMPKTVEDWFYFQLDYLKSQPKEFFEGKAFEDGGDNLFTKERRQTKKLVVKDAYIRGFVDRLEIEGFGKKVVLPFEEIVNMAIQTRNTLLIYTAKTMYVVKGQKRTNHYKYMASFYLNHKKDNVDVLNI